MGVREEIGKDWASSKEGIVPEGKVSGRKGEASPRPVFSMLKGATGGQRSLKGERIRLKRQKPKNRKQNSRTKVRGLQIKQPKKNSHLDKRAENSSLTQFRQRRLGGNSGLLINVFGEEGMDGWGHSSKSRRGNIRTD